MGLAEMTYCSRGADLEYLNSEMDTERDRPVMVVVADPARCNGCACCHSYLSSDRRPLEIDTGSAAPGGASLVVIDEPRVLCSNMQVYEPALAGDSLKDGLYRLTAADIEFLSKLDG